MARGLPAVWSALVAAPFVGGGLYVYFEDPNEFVPPEVGVPIAGFGLFILVLGLYIHFVAAPEPPKMRDGEELIETRTPAQRAALAKVLLGSGSLLVAGYFLFFTVRPYVYPAVAFAVGLYLLSTGLYTYWTNSLTMYYVTNRRIIKEYRFISLVKQEIPFEKVRGVEERKSIWEAIVGLGNVRVASGGGGALEVVVQNIYSPTEFADEVRNLL